MSDMKNIMALGIIFLLIITAVAPSINFSVVKASNDNEFVEVTSEACGIKGFGNTTVKLTRQQYQNLEQYLVEFRARLNKTTTREEAVPIFNEAVVELNKYRLLPKGMSVNQAQNLVLNKYFNEKLTSRLEQKYKCNQDSSDELINSFCLIAGKTNWTLFSPIVLIPLLFNSLLFFNLGYLFMLSGIPVPGVFFMFIGIFFESISYPWFLFKNILAPIVIGSAYMGDYFGPAYGWIYTLGLHGKRTINGTFYGNISILYPLYELLSSFGFLYEFPAIAGFQGLQIMFNIKDGKQFYLGSCLYVRVSPEMSW
jgi:hypothetical protein